MEGTGVNRLRWNMQETTQEDYTRRNTGEKQDELTKTSRTTIHTHKQGGDEVQVEWGGATQVREIYGKTVETGEGGDGNAEQVWEARTQEEQLHKRRIWKATHDTLRCFLWAGRMTYLLTAVGGGQQATFNSMTQSYLKAPSSIPEN